MGKVSIQITGGLGNQLFQYAAGLSLVENEPNRLDIEQKLGKPRSASKSNADMFGFTWPHPLDIIEVKPNRASRFMSRVTGYCLRLGVKPTNLESMRFVKSVILFLTSLLISMYLRKRKNVVVGSGVGYSKLKSDYSNQYLIG